MGVYKGRGSVLKVLCESGPGQAGGSGGKTVKGFNTQNSA